MKRENLHKLLFAVCLLLAVTAAILSAIAVTTDYDEHRNYFVKNAPVSLAACITAALSFAVGVAAIICAPCKNLQATPFRHSTAAISSAIGFLCAFVALLLQEHTELPSPILMMLVLGSLAISIIYAVLCSFPQILQTAPTVVAGVGLFAVLTCLFLNIYLYFDLTIEMNAPLKLFIQLGLLGAMIYYTTELRYLLGIPMPRLFLLASVATVSIGSLCVFALPVAFFTDKLPRFDYCAIALAVFAIIITVVLRVFALLMPAPDPEPANDSPIESASPETQSDSNDEI